MVTFRPHPLSRFGLPAVLAGVVLCSAVGTAGAQMVPRASHVLRSVGGSEYTFTRLEFGGANGLNFAGTHLWPQWEGRVGVMLDRPMNPLKDTYVLFQPVPDGLNMRGLHVLTDYYIDGGFRATAGMVRGEATQSWWDGGGGGLNISVQKRDSLNIPGQSAGIGLNPLDKYAAPYIGAGYTSRVNSATSPLTSQWRFNADLGLISINNNNFGRISRTLMGEQGFDTLVRDLKLRPLIKVSVGYQF